MNQIYTGRFYLSAIDFDQWRFFYQLVKKAFDQCNNKCGVPFEKNEFLTFLVCYTYLKNRSRHMRLSTLLSKHLTDAANIQESGIRDPCNSEFW
jgi:hypothetical protein